MNDVKLAVWVNNRPNNLMKEAERSIICFVLAQCIGNREKAAKLLGIGERTLYRKIKQHKIKL